MSSEHYELFDATRGDLDARARRRKERERLKERMRPLVTQLAGLRGPAGFTASDVLALAIAEEIVPEETVRHHPADYSFVGPWLHQLADEGAIAPKTVKVEGGVRMQISAPAARGDSKARQVKLWVALEYAA